MGQLDQKIDILVLCAEERFEHPALIDQLEQNALEEVSQGAIRDTGDNTGYK